jgi:CDP-6-deoxy-D-xylo-4-hexulose-3-dehydrase
MENNKLLKIRSDIADLVTKDVEEKYKPTSFVGGETVIPPSGKLMGEEELQNMVAASLDGWLTTGRFNTLFEKGLA